MNKSNISKLKLFLMGLENRFEEINQFLSI